MKKTLAVLGLAGMMTCAWAAGRAQGAQPLVFGSVDKATFKEVVPGVSKAVLWGSHEKGPYGAFTKFKPGFDAGMHTHAHDVGIMVIKGAYLYKDSAGEKRVGPSMYIRVPAGHKHWSGGDKAQGALFYEESPGGFDLKPVK